MPFNRPTLLDLVTRIKADLETRLSTAGASLRRSFIATIGKVMAGAAHLMHGHLDYISRQVFPDTADGDNLKRWASIWKIEVRPAVKATGTIVFTGTNGTLIPSGTLLLRSDSVEFSTTADGTISSGTATIAGTCSVAGETGNTDAAAAMSLSNPIAGVNSAAVVGTEFSGGTDVETDDSLRARLLERIGNPPLGGAIPDYEQWALEVSGVTRVWVKPAYLGTGTVGIFFVRDDDVSIIPDSGEVATVQAYIEERKPIPAKVTVLAPTGHNLNLTLSVSPDTAPIRTAIQAELEDMVYRDGEPGGTILLTHIQEAISLAAGENDHTLTSPTGNFTSTAGQLPVLGTITWI